VLNLPDNSEHDNVVLSLRSTLNRCGLDSMQETMYNGSNVPLEPTIGKWKWRRGQDIDRKGADPKKSDGRPKKGQNRKSKMKTCDGHERREDRRKTRIPRGSDARRSKQKRPREGAQMHTCKREHVAAAALTHSC
jgi:hypothetical protein